MRVVLATILMSVCSACALAKDDIHLLTPQSWAQTPTVPEDMNRRVEESAVEYQQYAPVPRIAYFDIAFPASAEEFQETGGYGVLLFTALSQDSGELPPKRLYVTLNGEEHLLTLISSTKAPPQLSRNVERVLGANRWDAIYLFPIHLMQDGATIALDFARNRDGFVISQFATADRAALGYEIPFGYLATLDEAQSATILRIVAREFPGFLDHDEVGES